MQVVEGLSRKLSTDSAQCHPCRGSWASRHVEHQCSLFFVASALAIRFRADCRRTKASRRSAVVVEVWTSSISGRGAFVDTSISAQAGCCCCSPA